MILERAVEDACVFSTHDHLRPMDAHPRPMSLVDLLKDSYAALAFRDADGSPHGMGTTNRLDANPRWREVAPLLSRMRSSSAFRILQSAFVDLYGVAEHDWSEAEYEALDRAVAERYADPGWLSDALDRARVVGVIWDNFWKPGEWRVPDDRFAPSMRIDSSVAAVDAVASDYVGCNLIRDWAGELGVEIRTLDDLEALITRVAEANLRAGGRSFKAAIAYDRSLLVREVPRSVAAAIFGRGSGSLTHEERTAFGDHVVVFCLEFARAHGMVFQVHTGTARLAGSDPTNLIPLLERFHDVVFDLFHMGYPWTREAAALARTYPNVRLNLTWLPNISMEVAVSVLKECLQAVPESGRITWGADAKTPEEMYGSVKAAKQVVARALGELVTEGQLSLDDALAEAERILWQSGAEIYGIDPIAQMKRLGG
jgi:predicted TIM-barrel fold metal-dependent hydrolase